MTRSTALTATLALFLVGVLVGVLATHAFYLTRLREPGGVAALGLRLLSWQLSWRLDLTPPQRAAVDRILADTRAEGLMLRHEMAPRVLALLQRSRQRIVDVLTPEQRVVFERFQRRHQRLIESIALPPASGAAQTVPAPSPTSSPDTATSTPAPR